ncbi:MAG: OmpA family protein [Candidatus Riflebacteria bacterium]|nr:OmpA family protein [Candidatus Riflebacteria bacterium]
MKIKSFTMFVLVGAMLLSVISTSFASESMRLASSLKKSPYDQSGRFEVGPFIGYHYFDDKQNLEDSFSYGGRFGYNFTSHLGAEITLGVVDADVDNKSLTGLVKGQYRSPTGSVDLKYYQVDAIYQFSPTQRLSPFVTAGIGRSLYDPGVMNNDTNTINLGVGAKYWVKDDIAVRVDVRAFEEKSFRNYCGTVELVYAFGGRAEHKEIVVEKPEPVTEPVEVVVVSEESPVVEETVRSVAAKPGIIVLAFEDIHFNFDSSTLTETAKIILRRSVRILKDNPEAKVRIAGYTSASGSNEYNQRLSERRAGAVEKYLIENGFFSPDRLSTVGYGENNPAEYEAAPKQLYSKAAMSNMRVLFETILIN